MANLGRRLARVVAARLSMRSIENSWRRSREFSLESLILVCHLRLLRDVKIKSFLDACVRVKVAGRICLLCLQEAQEALGGCFEIVAASINLAKVNKPTRLMLIVSASGDCNYRRVSSAKEVLPRRPGPKPGGTESVGEVDTFCHTLSAPASSDHCRRRHKYLARASKSGKSNCSSSHGDD